MAWIAVVVVAVALVYGAGKGLLNLFRRKREPLKNWQAPVPQNQWRT